LQIMRWPYDARLEPTHAWGAIGVGVAGLIGIPTVLVATHIPGHMYRWWWPTDWMLVPAFLALIGVFILAVPLRSKSADVVQQADHAEPISPRIIGIAKTHNVSGEVTGVSAEIVKNGYVHGVADAEEVSRDGKLRGVHIRRIG
jgi:hypothetical protein